MDVISLMLGKRYTNEQLHQKDTNFPTKTVSFDGDVYSVDSDVVNGQVSVVLKGRTVYEIPITTWEQGLIQTSGTDAAATNRIRIPGTNPILIEIPGAEITISAKPEYIIGRVHQYDSAMDWIRGDMLTTITLDSRCKYIRFSLMKPYDSDILPSEADNANVRVNYTSVKSTNSVRIRSVNEDETKESIAYVNLPQGEELRSLPNGVKDEVSVADGVKTQRVSEYVLKASDFTDFSQFTSVDQISFRKSILQGYAYPSTNDAGIIGSVNLFGYGETTVTSGSDNADYINTLATRIDTVRFRIILEKGKYSSLAEASADLAGLTLNYQLAEPIVTQLSALPPLEIFPNGYIFVEPIGDPAETALPTVEMTVPVGTSNKFGIATHDYDGAAADWVLTKNESNCGILIVTNAGGNANIIVPNVPGKFYFVKNDSGYDIVVKSAGDESGTTIADGNSTIVFNTDD